MVETNGLTHISPEGNAWMVDVSGKDTTHRTARAYGEIYVNQEVMKAITQHTAKKGDVLQVARIAGIMATKRTSELIPLCHPLFLTKAQVDFEVDEKALCIKAICLTKTTGQTGVEMEALMGVSTALLTIYDMCKALDRGMQITNIHLLEKMGGKSGHYVARENERRGKE